MNESNDISSIVEENLIVEIQSEPEKLITTVSNKRRH